ncbi:protein PLASTID MOVEMENT IMPAIRED 1 [Cynara cardunculus var. scolymus]|uniref:protein PLASTID MOVEMENT IMPAIRED 1 n=1 Tax=Cynara cardunculus var. scolymus TaxID=59895 RepID=UPI000D629550|nr:protein PLASTID MOVEMENT IMPAIRED 1 [Cynara cardunculus var. scolymus]
MAENNPPDRRNSNTQLLEELEALSLTLNNTNTSSVPATKNRRTNSLVLSRASIPPILSTGKTDHADDDDDQDGIKLNPKPRARRMSLSPWRSRPSEETSQKQQAPVVSKNLFRDSKPEKESSSEKKGLWNWKPIRVLSHIGKQKLSCLLSVEVVTVQGLPASMNGLRLSVSVRKKETKDGAVQTMPSRVSQGAADFEETLFIRCHVYCTPAGSGNPRAKFEPRPFIIHAFAVDAEELDFGRHAVDLSQLIQESIEKNFEGTRIRQWDMSFNLSGKAKGGELVMKLGFQIMEKEGGVGIYNQVEGQKSGKSKMFSPSIGRKQSKSSFSVPSPRIPNRAEVYTPSQRAGNVDFQGIDDLNLDEPPQEPVATVAAVSPPPVQMTEEPESKLEDLDLPDFEVVDKGIEVQDRDGMDGTQSEDNSDKRSISSEVVKEVVHDQVHLTRLSELDSIAQQIKALESMMAEEKNDENDQETESQGLDEDEDKVTREFFQMLEHEDGKEASFEHENSARETDDGYNEKVFVPDLGKGLGCVIQTRNGGYLVSMNPFDNLMGKKDTPKLAMQISRPMVLTSNESLTGTEFFQRMAAIGFEELSSEILSLMPMEELVGKTAEQTAFEGIASTIISGRNKEGATSSATRAITIVKSMATGMTSGRKERISSGIWNMNENPLTGEEILACSLQKIEEMAVEALKVQADITKETAPFDVSPSNNSRDGSHPLTTAMPLEDWMKDNGIVTSQNEHETVTISVVIQMRDPLRQYEAVGGPLIALVHATSVEAEPAQEKRFKIASLNVGGLKLRSGGKKNDWDTEKQRLTAMQWLVGYGLGKAGKKGKRVMVKGPDLLWSLSSRVMADMWLKSIRNPDVKFTT